MRKGTALVTGASMGLGAILARLFAADGHNLILTARSEDKLAALAAELRTAHGVEVRVEPCDLADPAAPKQLADRLADTPIDFLVNNAGFGTQGRFVKLDRQKELDEIQVNVAALTDLTRLFLPGMVERGFGRVLNVASTAGFQPGPFMATYYATKAYVISFSEGIAEELRGTGVTVTAHCPGATRTEFAANAGIEKSRLFKLGPADATEVATHAYRAMHAGRVVAIHGLKNWLGAFSIRFSPRVVVRRLVAWINQEA
ncbi:MAG: SDR family oxidoreductase [Myxococcales bacterium]|nr:SDR family oxidoreductase [Myxococcales bacterium]